MNKREILTSLREFFTDPTHWTKGAFWRDGLGQMIPVDPIHQEKIASCCLIGGFYKVAPSTRERSDAEDLVYRCIRERGVFAEDIVDFNDGKYTTHADVLSVIDCAIEHAKEGADGNANQPA